MKDFKEKFKNKPMSWSYYSSFLYNKERWFKKYYLGQEQASSDAMDFGKEVGEKLASDETFMPEVKRYKHFEQLLEAKIGKMKLIGYMDTSDLENKKLREFKTGNNKNPWTQKRVDEHGQLTMYALMIMLSHNIKPEELEIHLDWLPTLESDFSSVEDFLTSKPKVRFDKKSKLHSFKTKRTTKDCLMFGAELTRTWKAMEEYIHLCTNEEVV